MFHIEVEFSQRARAPEIVPFARLELASCEPEQWADLLRPIVAEAVRRFKDDSFGFPIDGPYELSVKIFKREAR